MGQRYGTGVLGKVIGQAHGAKELDGGMMKGHGARTWDRYGAGEWAKVMGQDHRPRAQGMGQGHGAELWGEDIGQGCGAWDRVMRQVHGVG